MVPQRQKGNKSLRCLMFLYLILVGDSVRAFVFVPKRLSLWMRPLKSVSWMMAR